MTNSETVLAELERLREENALLRKQQQLPYFFRMPEQTETYECLRNGKIPIFKEVSKLSHVKPGEPSITLIEGDNLAFLAAAQMNFENKVDVLYLDPPYNTGKDIYTYQDRHGVRQDKHSYWVSAIERRLKLALPLLRNTGVIMCAIGVNELARLRLVMDDIFGESNFIANVTWSGSFINNAPFVSTSSDYMLIYAKDALALKEFHPKWRTQKKHAEHLLDVAEGIWLSCGKDVQESTRQLRKFYLTSEAKNIFAIEPGLKMYNSFDNEGNLYRASDLSSPNGVGLSYDVVNPHTGQLVAVPKRGWVHSEKTFQKYVAEGKILWNGSGVPSFKRLLKDSLSVVLKDLIIQDREPANKLLARQIGRNKFSYPKDHNVLAEWFEYVTPDFRKNNKDDPFLLLDIYAGSGSSALAISQLNSLDNGNRECILVTTNESSICENVTAMRLKNVLSGKWYSGEQEPMLGSLKYFRTSFVGKKAALNEKLDERNGFFMRSYKYSHYVAPIIKAMFA